MRRVEEAKPELSAELRAARRAIIDLEGVELLEDWEWNRSTRRWVLQLRLKPDIDPSGHVPDVTDWFVLASPAYPMGPLKFNPARQQGLARTFQHQSYNDEKQDSLPWRKGVLCLDTSARVLGRRIFDIEPYDADRRLRWHVLRAIGWLEAASRDELVQAGDPFELPEYLTDPNTPLSIAFSESPASFTTWEEIHQQVGILDYYVLRREVDVQVVKSFKTLEGKDLLMPAWGPAVTHGASVISHGLWLRLPSTPVLEPWQAPVKWGELRAVCHEQGVALDELLRVALEAVRDKAKFGHVAMIGFPIPSNFGGSPERMHWLAVHLPNLVGVNEQTRGFRPGKKWSWQHNRERLMRDSAPLRWLGTENWYPDQLQTRGRLPLELTSQKFMLLGAGALGSPVAELLARGGVLSISIVDDDQMKAGNLVRHTLGLDDLNKYKAAAVAKRLNEMSPFAHATAITTQFPPTHPTIISQVNECEIIVDCTGSDELLYDLSAFAWKEEHLFFSFSISLGGRRCYCFAARGEQFPHDSFKQLIDPWLRKDLEENADKKLPREGIGCWHPVFWARADDIWLMASAAVKYLERSALSSLVEPQLVVFEQDTDANGDFSGVHKVSIEGLR